MADLHPKPQNGKTPESDLVHRNYQRGQIWGCLGRRRSPVPALRPSTAVSSLTARRLTRLGAGSCQRRLTAVPKPRRPAPRRGVPWQPARTQCSSAGWAASKPQGAGPAGGEPPGGLGLETASPVCEASSDFHWHSELCILIAIPAHLTRPLWAQTRRICGKVSNMFLGTWRSSGSSHFLLNRPRPSDIRHGRRGVCGWDVLLENQDKDTVRTVLGLSTHAPQDAPATFLLQRTAL